MGLAGSRRGYYFLHPHEAQWRAEYKKKSIKRGGDVGIWTLGPNRSDVTSVQVKDRRIANQVRIFQKHHLALGDRGLF